MDQREMFVRLRGMAWLAVCLFPFCATTAAGGANPAYNFLRSDISSRAAGMGGSFVGILDDPTSIFFNPAGLSTLSRPAGSVGFFKHLLDINTGYVAFTTPVEGAGFVGASVLYTDYGSFDRTDEASNVLGEFSAGDLSFAVAYSNLLQEHLHFGITVKYIHAIIDQYTSSAFAADFGILYNIPDSRVTLGASVLNLGTQVTEFESTAEDLPLDIVIGGSVVPRGIPLLLHLSFHKLNAETENFADRFRSFRVGGEFTLSQALRLRFGYDNEKRTDLKIGNSAGLAGFSGGLGIVVSDYRIDYALSSWGNIGELHRFSVAASF
ncbi:MAG: type IX secretion system protein PorQ [Ignavibacteria bacterium]|nr:type IX secretion system protein PorQ [Ignavibacteria bacterium]